MKSLVQLIIVVIVCTMTTELIAQNFGVKAGLNLSTMLAKDEDENYSDEFKMNPGFHLGATIEFPLSESFSFETGLLLSTKGFKISEEDTYDGETFKYVSKTNLFYLDIPLTAKASVDLGGARIYGAFGPYIGIGLSGKTKFEATGPFGETESGGGDIKWGSDENEDFLKRLDYGLILGAGLEIGSVQFGVSYGLGLANISSYTGEGAVLSNRVLGFSVVINSAENRKSARIKRNS